MFPKIWRFITVTLAARALTMPSAHVLELPQKMQYDAQMYSAVNTTLYRYFAYIGGFYTMGSVLTAFVLAFFVRKRGSTFPMDASGRSLSVARLRNLAHDRSARQQ